MRTILALLVALSIVAITDTAQATGGRRSFLRQRQQVIVQPRQRIVVQQQRFAQPRVQRFVIQQPQQFLFTQPIFTQPLVVPRQQILIIH